MHNREPTHGNQQLEAHVMEKPNPEDCVLEGHILIFKQDGPEGHQKFTRTLCHAWKQRSKDHEQKMAQTITTGRR